MKKLKKRGYKVKVKKADNGASTGPVKVDKTRVALKKGSTIYIEGQLQTRKWQDQNGVDKYTTEIVLGRFRGELAMIGSRNDNLSPNNVSENLDQNNQNSLPAKEIEPPMGGAGDLDDEIPF